MRLPRTTLLLVATLATACSSDPTAPQPEPDALAAATQFQQLADDAFTSGADPDVMVAYRDISREVARAGRLSPVTITIDGVPMEFLAVAREVSVDAGPTCSQPGSLCLLLPPLRSVVAWQKDNPRRLVQLTSSAGTTAIAQIIPGSVTGAFLNTATLTYFDGAGGFYVGTSGTHNISNPVTSATPCNQPTLPSTSSYADPSKCTRAEFTASFSGTVAPPPVTLQHNTASGTHTIAMAPQPVHGVKLVLPAEALPCAACGGYPVPLLPPVNLRGNALPATLTTATSAGDVAFTLTVTNPFPTAITVNFISGQQSDFRVLRSDGTIVWTASQLVDPSPAPTSRTIASGATVVYTAHWTPTEHGTLFAEGWLTSSSHHARGQALLVVP